jgi:transcriptional regulator with XRE-family HTH domain
MAEQKAGSNWDAYVKQLGQNIAKVRNDKKYSQERVAYDSKLSRYTFQKLEKGESNPGTSANPSLKNVLAIAQALGVTLGDLLPGEQPDLRNR